jgi:hypothetical protein
MASGHTMDIEVVSEGYWEKFAYISFLISGANEFQQLTDCCSLLSKKQDTWRKTPCNNIPWKMGTCPQLPTAIQQENSNLIWKIGVSDFYPCNTWQVQFIFSSLNCLVQNLNYRHWWVAPHSVFVCFVRIWEHTAIISLCSIKWLVFVTEMERVYCAVRAGY